MPVKGWRLMLLTGLMVILSCSLAVAGAKISSQTKNPEPGKAVNFSYSNPDTSECLIWDFGDGSSKKTVESRFTIQHKYKKPGRYRVKV